jgi:hypothetical protein
VYQILIFIENLRYSFQEKIWTQKQCSAHGGTTSTSHKEYLRHLPVSVCWRKNAVLEILQVEVDDDVIEKGLGLRNKIKWMTHNTKATGFSNKLTDDQADVALNCQRNYPNAATTRGSITPKNI